MSTGNPMMDKMAESMQSADGHGHPHMAGPGGPGP